MSYSGKASFVHEIERMKNKKTGELVHLDSVSDEMEEAYEYLCIPLKIEGTSYYQEAKTFGLPENCYPEESETEITSIVGPDGKDWEDRLSGKEKETILGMVASESECGDDADESDYEDEDYDPWQDDGSDNW